MVEASTKAYSIKTVNVKQLVESGDYFVICDTNIFLDIYRCSPDFSEFALSCLEKVSEYIKIPYTVKIEYYNHNKELYKRREEAIANVASEIEKFSLAQKEKMSGTLSPLKKHHFPDIEDTIKAIECKYDEIILLLSKYLDEHKVLTLLSSGWSEDLVEKYIADCIKKLKVLPDFPRDEIYRICEDGKKRYKDQIPPGYKDAREKDGIRKYSDLIMWKEVIRFAHDNQKNIIFVTDDVKADWWEKDEKGYAFLQKLIAEFEKESAKRAGENNGIKGSPMRIIPLVSSDFYEAVSNSYGIERGDAIQQALELTDDYYIDAIQDAVFDEVWKEFQYSGTKYIDEGIFHELGSMGISEWEVVDWRLDTFEVYNRVDDEIEYHIKFKIWIDGISDEYLGCDDETTMIYTEPYYEHQLHGTIEVSIKRVVFAYLDFEEDSDFNSVEIICTTFEEDKCVSLFHDYCDSDARYCPRCGVKINEYNDGGAFCTNCMLDD